MARRFDDEEEVGHEGASEDGIEEVAFDLEDEDDDSYVEEEEDDEEEEFSDDEDDDIEEDEDEDDDEGNEFTDVDSVVEEAEELIEAGEHAKAIELVQGGIEFFPEEAKLHYLLGIASFESLREDIEHAEMWEDDADMVEMYEQAASGFEEALNLAPDHVDSLNALGALYAIRGNHEGAIGCWERSLEIDADQSTVISDIRMSRKKMESD